MKHFGVGLACVVGGGLMFSVPYFIRSRTSSLERKDGILTGTQRQRGMYIQAGSHDAGIDPDWDPVDRKWRGNERKSSTTTTSTTTKEP